MGKDRRVRAGDRLDAKTRDYLGDGVYAAFDGFGIWLTAENGIRATDAIYLEPEALAELVRFTRVIIRRLVADRDARLARCEDQIMKLQERVTALQGDGSGHLHRCARVNGQWACDKACRVADRDARLARLVKALTEAVRFVKSGSHATFHAKCESDCFVGAMFNRWRVVLADAGAGNLPLTAGKALG